MELNELKKAFIKKKSPSTVFSLENLNVTDQALFYELVTLYLANRAEGKSFVKRTSTFRKGNLTGLRELLFDVIAGNYKTSTPPVYKCKPIEKLRDDVKEVILSL